MPRKSLYEAKEYPVDENDLSGSHAADMLGVDHGSVFKTLVLKENAPDFSSAVFLWTVK